jgi:pimeloyl-ACP methyl ester carboxylesterase
MKIITSIIAILLIASCQKEKISTNKANDVFFLKEGGSSMPIQVYGNLASNKIMLIVHGGPGGTAITYRNDVVRKTVETEFAIAYWDQRVAGTTQGSVSSGEISLYKEDLKKVITVLKTRYGANKKMYLFGHSWGGFLSPYFLEDGSNQDLVKGWIQVDGANSYALNDSLTKEMLLVYGKREIAKDKNKDKWKEIVDFCNAHPYNENFDVAFKLNRYASKVESYLDEIVENEKVKEDKYSSITNRYATTSALSNIISSALIKKIDRQAYKIPITENLNKLKLPTLLLWGRHDFVCPIGLKDVIKKNIKSTDVTEKTFEQSGHSPMDNEPALFWSTVVDWVKKH